MCFAVQEALRRAICRSIATPRQVCTKSRFLLIKVGQACVAEWTCVQIAAAGHLLRYCIPPGWSAEAYCKVTAVLLSAGQFKCSNSNSTIPQEAVNDNYCDCPGSVQELMSLGQQPVPAQERSSPAVMGACCPQPLLTMAFVTAVMERDEGPHLQCPHTCAQP